MTTATRPRDPSAPAAVPDRATGAWACCTPLTREALSAEAAARLAAVLKAVADPTRLRLLSLIYAHEGG
nr:hypothetical protein [Frankia sp. Cas3]